MFFNKHLPNVYGFINLLIKIIRHPKTTESKSFSNILFTKCRRFTRRKQKTISFYKACQMTDKSESRN